MEDLGNTDGMLLVWPYDTNSSFWMKDTLIPLDLAAFTEGSALVDLDSMQPCSADPCQTYPLAGPYRYAPEAPAGVLTSLDDLYPKL